MTKKTKKKSSEKGLNEYPLFAFMDDGTVIVPVILESDVFKKLLELALRLNCTSHTPPIVLSEMVNHYLPSRLDAEISHVISNNILEQVNRPAVH